MPIREYACSTCQHTFEALVLRAADEAEVRCPACGGTDVARLMSRPSTVGGGGAADAASAACGPVG